VPYVAGVVFFCRKQHDKYKNALAVQMINCPNA